MAVSWQSDSAWTYSTGTVATGAFSQAQDGDLIVLHLASKYEGATVTTPDGWTSAGSAANSGLSTGNDSGNLIAYTFYRVFQTGDQPPTFDPTGNNVSGVVWSRYRSGTGLYDVQCVMVADDTVGATFTAGQVTLDLATGDNFTMVQHLNGDVVTTTGSPTITWGSGSPTFTNMRDDLASGSTTSGTDMRNRCIQYYPSSGAASNPTISITLGGTTTTAAGIWSILRIREVFPSQPAPVSPSVSVVATGSLTGSTGSAPVSPSVTLVATGSTNIAEAAPVALSVALVATGSTNIAEAAPVSPSVSVVATGSTGITGSAPVDPSVALVATGSTGITGSAPVGPAVEIVATGSLSGGAFEKDAPADVSVALVASGGGSEPAPVNAAVTLAATGSTNITEVAPVAAGTALVATGSITGAMQAALVNPSISVSAVAAPLALSASAPVSPGFSFSTSGGLAGGGVATLPPVLVTSYAPASQFDATTWPKTYSVTCAEGDVLIHVAERENAASVFAAPTGGTNITWTQIGTAGGNENQGHVRAWATTIAEGNSQTFTLSQAGGTHGGCETFRFSGSDGYGAVANLAASDTSDLNINLTTTQDDSAILLAVTDWNAVDHTTRDWDLTPVEVIYQFASGRATYMGALYEDMDAAGTKAIGISTSSGAMRPAYVAVEVKGTAPKAVFKSSSALAGSADATPNVPVPVGAASGDIAVVSLFVQGWGTVTPPTGFTLKWDSSVTHGETGSYKQLVYWKRLTGADTGTYDFTATGAAWTSAVCAVYDGCVTSGDPFSDYGVAVRDSENGGDATSITVSGVVASDGDALFGAATGWNWGSWTPPTGTTERVDLSEGVTLASANDLSTGAIGDKTFTIASTAAGMKAFVGLLAAEGAGGGTPTVALAGMGTAESFGSPVISTSVGVAPSSISSTEAFGTLTIAARLDVAPTGIASEEAFGSPHVAVTPTGIASEEAFGTLTVNVEQTASPTALASEEAVGSPTVSYLYTSRPDGIASEEAFGSPEISTVLSVSIDFGMGSEAVVGTPTVYFIAPVAVTGITSAEAFGTPTITLLTNVGLLGLPSEEAFGTVVISGSSPVTATPTGIASEEASGSPAVNQSMTFTPTGIPSTEVFGATPALVPIEASGGNVLTNSSFESNTSPWLITGGTLTQDSSDGLVGSASLLVTSTQSSDLVVYSPIAAEFVASKDDIFSAATYVKWVSGTPRQVRLDIIYRSGSADLETNLGTASSVGTDGWVHLENFNTDAPNTTQYVRVRVTALNATSGDSFRIDAIQLEPAASLDNFNEGVPAPPPITATPTGIASEEAFGTPVASILYTVYPVGVEGDEAVGSPDVSTVLGVAPAGIESVETIGTLTVATVLSVVLAGIASEEALGTLTSTTLLGVSPAGIPSEEAFGALSIGEVTEALFSGWGIPI